MPNVINATSTGNGGLITQGDDSGILNIQTNETTAITVDASQNVGIGTSSPSYRVDAVGSGSPSTGILRSSSNLTNSTTKYGYYTVGHYTNATAPFGFIQGESNSTENNVHIGGGAGEVTAATRIDFYTAANNTTSSGTERMRIDSSGNLYVGQTSGDYVNSNSLKLATATNTGYLLVSHINGSSSGNVFVGFGYNGSAIGSITQNGTTAVAYNTSSDYRLKENIAPLTGALNKVSQLKPVSYTWKASPDETGEGFIAHELAEVCPQAVHGTKDEVDADGNPKYQGIDTSFLVATLTTAIQELKAINDTQAETITALTARIVALEEK
jgi:hypothetical protein